MDGVRIAKSALKSVLPEPAVAWIGSRKARWKDKHEFRRDLRRSDVFLVGHPKSGNTLLAYMLGCLMEEKLARQVTLANVGSFVPTIHSADYLIRSYSELPSPRIFRTESPLYSDLYPSTIYLVRDPRAVFVSYFHHCVHDLKDYEWPLSSFVEVMLSRGCIERLEPQLVRWDRQVSEWLDRARRQRVKIVKYEDMVRDRYSMLKEVAEFAGLTSDETDLRRAAERGSFENMRKSEQLHGAESYAGERGQRGFFVRKGKPDGWKEELPPEIAERIEHEFSTVMKRVGYMEGPGFATRSVPTMKGKQCR